MALSRLYLITDRKQTLGRSILDVVKSALEGGVRMVQLREKDLSGKELYHLAKELRVLTDKYGARLLINDRVDVALAVNADGVQLGRRSISARDAKRAFKNIARPPATSHQPLIGVSTHSLNEALQAEKDGADFITFGPVYYTPSKAEYGNPVGIDKLREAANKINLPVYALGGIKEENVRKTLDAGAYGVAAISAIMAAEDMGKASGELLREIAACRPPATNYCLM